MEGMPILRAALVLAMVCAPLAVSMTGYAGQAAGAPAQVAPAASPAPALTQDKTSVKASELVQPALDALEKTVTAANLDKWKRGTVRDEAAANVHRILNDLQSTLPDLLKQADAASGTMSKVLPVARNMDALYDVVLRVVDGARVAAPADQVDALIQAMNNLEKARLALADRQLELAAAQEKQIVDLQVALKTQPAPVCPVVAPVESKPAAPAAAKKAVKKKPAAKPAVKPPTTPPAATAQPAPTAKPSS